MDSNSVVQTRNFKTSRVCSVSRLQPTDFKIVDEYSIKCKLCNDYTFSLFLSPEDYLFHVKNSHTTVHISNTFDSERRTIFGSRVKSELDELDVDNILIVTPTIVQCCSCSKQVDLEVPYSPDNFVKHLKENNCFRKKHVNVKSLFCMICNALSTGFHYGVSR